MRSEEVAVDGLRIAYRRAGNGPSLMLLHGFFGDSRVWHLQLDSLSDEFDVVAWDAPGSGQSSDVPDTFRIADYAMCLAGFIQQLRLERLHVLGLSFGSTLALELYRQNRALPRTLILASAYAGWAGSLPPEVVEHRVRQTIPDLDLPPAQVVLKYNSPGLLTSSAPPALLEANAAIISDFRPAGMKTMVHAIAEADLRDVLGHINVPVLLLYGDQDVRSPLDVAAKLHAQISASKLVVLRGVGHLCNFEAPDRFNAEVRAFLRSE